MIHIHRTGTTLADMATHMRDVPARVLPYAAASALTQIARSLAKTELPAAMRSAFDRPTPWVLNSLAIEPANKSKLAAAIYVKNVAGGRAITPERTLMPQVFGGKRGEKRIERALRYSGILTAGDHLYPARDLARDAYGNAPPAILRSVLAWASSGAARKAKRTKNSAATNPRGYFLFGKAPGVRGVAQRQGGTFNPLLIISRTAPSYRPRLDYAGIAQRYTTANFPAVFDSAARAILARPQRARTA